VRDVIIVPPVHAFVFNSVLQDQGEQMVREEK
jgi:hypothetical protein